MRLRQDAADLPGVRARLAEQLASCRQAEAAAGQLRRELAQAQAAAEEAKSQRDAARAAAQQAAADAEEQRTAVAAWRTDVEAASLQVARAVGRAELLEAQVQQLEGANAGLRMDNQAHAARLKAAYERWVGGWVVGRQLSSGRGAVAGLHDLSVPTAQLLPQCILNAARASCWQKWRRCRPGCGKRAGSSPPQRCQRPQPALRCLHPALPAHCSAWSRRSTTCLWQRRGS